MPLWFPLGLWCTPVRVHVYHIWVPCTHASECAFACRAVGSLKVLVETGARNVGASASISMGLHLGSLWFVVGCHWVCTIARWFIWAPLACHRVTPWYLNSCEFLRWSCMARLCDGHSHLTLRVLVCCGALTWRRPESRWWHSGGIHKNACLISWACVAFLRAALFPLSMHWIPRWCK